MGKVLNNPTILSLLLITFLSMLAYLPLIPFLGFYSDDFFFAYVSHFYGIPGIIQSLIVDRPFNGYLLIFNYFFLGLQDNIFLWHIYIFLIKLLGGYALFFSLRKIFPNKLSTISSITLLFLIYPGFLQQTLPLGYGNWVTTLTLWVISLTFTITALKQKKTSKLFLFTVIALFLQVNAFLQLEFFIGMEILRLLIVTLVLENKISINTIKKTLIYWSPYLISLILFVIWRILIFKSTREVTDINWVILTYYSNPLWIAKIPLELIHSFSQTVIFAYFIPLVINFIRLPLQNSVVSISLGIFAGVLLHFYFKKIPEIKSDKKIGKQLFIIGLVSVFVALTPEILAGRTVRIYSVLDRYTITSIIGVTFIIVGLLLFKFNSRVYKWTLIILVGFSITSHVMNGYWHNLMWDKQNNLWWQLYWRAPSIQNNTMLILDFPPLTQNIPFKDIINKVKWYRFYWAEEQIWTEGNLFFNYNNPPENHFYGDFLQDEDILKKIKEGSVETFNNRNIIYTRDFKKNIIIRTPSDTSCLKVLDGDKLIKPKPSIPPPKHIFGSEPPHNWCYYFQKASLARQVGDLNKLSKLKKEVIKKNLKPKDPNEWWIFKEDLR